MPEGNFKHSNNDDNNNTQQHIRHDHAEVTISSAQPKENQYHQMSTRGAGGCNEKSSEYASFLGADNGGKGSAAAVSDDPTDGVKSSTAMNVPTAGTSLSAVTKSISSIATGCLPAANVPTSSSPSPLVLSSLPPVRPRGSNPSTAPVIFQNRKLRSGKWIPEEEKYAELLISLFEKGLIADCENGATLRSYLSHKLHCAPMRISKKFAGKGIGKLVYLSKVNLGITIPPIERQGLENEVKEREQRFYQAIFPGCDSFSLAYNTLAPNVVASMPSVSVFPGVVPLIPPQTYTKPLVLSQSTFGALASNINGQGKLQDAAKPVAPQFQTSFPNTAVSVHVAKQDSSYQSAQTMSLPSIPAVSLPVNAGNQSTTASVLLPMAAALNPQPSQQQAREAPVRYTSCGASLKRRSPSGEIPDFLAGFDRVALKLGSSEEGGVPHKKEVTSTGSVVCLQSSPPFTSRSFDEFHRFLGKDLPVLDDSKSSNNSMQGFVPGSNEARSSGSATTGQSRGENGKKDNEGEGNKALDSTALFSAESYALLAQETVITESLHDGCLTKKLGLPAVTSGGTFDIDKVVKLVSEHVGGPLRGRQKQQQLPQTQQSREGDEQQTKNELLPGATGQVQFLDVSAAAPALATSATATATNGMTFTSIAPPIHRGIITATTPERSMEPDNPNVVSEPASSAETESGLSSFREFTSESNGSDDDDDDNSTGDGDASSSHYSSSDFEGSVSGDEAPQAPPRKKTKLTGNTTTAGGGSKKDGTQATSS